MRGLARRARGWQEGKRRRPIENQEPPFNHPHRHPPCSVAAAGTRRKERDREAAKNDCATRAKMTNCTAPVSLLVCLDLECGRGKYVVKTTPENWGRIIASVLCDRKQRSQSTDSSVLFICLPPLPLHPLLFLHHSRLARARHMLSVQEFHFSARCRGLPAQLLKTRRVFGGSVGDIKVRPAWPWSNLLREGTKERRCRSRERAGAGGEAAEWRGRVAHPGENDRRRDRQPRGETGSPTDRIAQVALQRKKRRGHDALDVPEAFRLLWNG